MFPTMNHQEIEINQKITFQNEEISFFTSNVYLDPMLRTHLKYLNLILNIYFNMFPRMKCQEIK